MLPETLDEADSTVIENKAQLVEYLAAGCKPPEQFRLGSEQEMFVFSGDDYSPAAYDGPEPGIKALLEGMTRFGWQPIEENGLPIALWRKDCTITLEPGGQFELSGAALRDAHQTLQETQAYHAELEILAGELGLSFLALGHQPKHARKDLPWMPKERYKLMRAYMPSRGSLGLDMMQSTCAHPGHGRLCQRSRHGEEIPGGVGTATDRGGACLPIRLSSMDEFSGYLSCRAATWSDTDPDRCGSLPFVFEDRHGI